MTKDTKIETEDQDLCVENTITPIISTSSARVDRLTLSDGATVFYRVSLASPLQLGALKAVAEWVPQWAALEEVENKDDRWIFVFSVMS